MQEFPNLKEDIIFNTLFKYPDYQQSFLALSEIAVDDKKSDKDGLGGFAVDNKKRDKDGLVGFVVDNKERDNDELGSLVIFQMINNARTSNKKILFINEKDSCDMLINKLDNEIPKEYPYNYFNIFK